MTFVLACLVWDRAARRAVQPLWGPRKTSEGWKGSDSIHVPSPPPQTASAAEVKAGLVSCRLGHLSEERQRVQTHPRGIGQVLVNQHTGTLISLISGAEPRPSEDTRAGTVSKLPGRARQRAGDARTSLPLLCCGFGSGKTSLQYQGAEGQGHRSHSQVDPTQPSQEGTRAECFLTQGLSSPH